MKSSVEQDARQFATDVAEKATQSAQRQFASGKERAADTIDRLAGALRQTGQNLGTDDMPQVTAYIGRAASEAERFSEYLKNTSFGQVVGDLEKLARREPFLFLGGALVVGLVGGRFLKSSPATRTPSWQQSMAGGEEAAR